MSRVFACACRVIVHIARPFGVFAERRREELERLRRRVEQFLERAGECGAVLLFAADIRKHGKRLRQQIDAAGIVSLITEGRQIIVVTAHKIFSVEAVLLYGFFHFVRHTQ